MPFILYPVTTSLYTLSGGLSRGNVTFCSNFCHPPYPPTCFQQLRACNPPRNVSQWHWPRDLVPNRPLETPRAGGRENMIVVPDAINGLFEITGGFVVLLNVRQILRDKCVRGVHWGPCLFFSIWGWWNLFYYPFLEQWISTAGAGFVALSNTTWCVMVLKYWRQR